MHKVDIEQGSYEWHCMRQGIVTGTTLKSALGTTKVQNTLMYKIISERMTEPQIDDINSAAITRGREMEPIALRVVSKNLDIDFATTGMLFSDRFDGFGFSPDAIFESDGEIVGGLEIKCPGSKKHIEYLIDGGLPKEYADQVRSPFLMSDKVEWWYFVSFDDRNYERPLHIIKLTRIDFEKELPEQRTKLQGFLNRVDTKHAELTF